MLESSSIAFVLALIAIIGLIAGLHRWLRGEDLSRYDGPGLVERFAGSPPDHPDQRKVRAILAPLDAINRLPFHQRLAALRRYMDELFDEHPFVARFVPVEGGTVNGEWVLAPGSSPSRRTLYIHGGAFVTGSPRSHRTLTSRFSELTGGAVFAVAYRLMPEHSRLAGIEDCRAAYLWLLDNGPEGPGPAEAVFVAGDSAGGNLALSLLAWARDTGVRAPDAAVALSPLTDACLSGETILRNHRTDPMLAPMAPWAAWPRPLARFVAPWFGWLHMRQVPHRPMISPLRGDLSGLPPVLIHVSESELLLDDGLRYANKARAAGSRVTIQTWGNMMHVWQIFDLLRESGESHAEIERFIRGVRPMPATAPGAQTIDT